jgi:hypothetical protein
MFICIIIIGWLNHLRCISCVCCDARAKNCGGKAQTQWNMTGKQGVWEFSFALEIVFPSYSSYMNLLDVC